MLCLINKKYKLNETKSMSRSLDIQGNDESIRIERFYEVYSKKMYDFGREFKELRDIKDENRN